MDLGSILGKLDDNTDIGLMGKLAGAMDTIGDTLAKVGQALAKLGDHLDDSGAQARGFAQPG